MSGNCVSTALPPEAVQSAGAHRGHVHAVARVLES